MQPFAIGLRSIAHSIAKQYYITHTYSTHINIYVCLHVLKYFRVVTLQNDISFKWSRRAQCSKFQEIPQGFMFLHLTKGQTAATSKQNTPPLSIFGAAHTRLRLRLLAGFGTLLLCAWPHQKPSQMFTSCLRFLCFFCFCFSVVDVVVVCASFITPYFMLVLAFCLLLSFRLWIVVKFFVIINFFLLTRFSGFVFEACFRERLWVWSASGQGTNAKVILASASFGASFSY